MVHSSIELRRLVLTLTDREDGGLHISSPDVPGLHLSGRDKQRVWGMVPPLVTGLLAANKKLRVLQVYLPADEAALVGTSPRELNIEVRTTSVVIEVEMA